MGLEKEELSILNLVSLIGFRFFARRQQTDNTGVMTAAFFLYHILLVRFFSACVQSTLKRHFGMFLPRMAAVGGPSVWRLVRSASTTWGLCERPRWRRDTRAMLRSVLSSTSRRYISRSTREVHLEVQLYHTQCTSVCTTVSLCHAVYEDARVAKLLNLVLQLF